MYCLGTFSDKFLHKVERENSMKEIVIVGGDTALEKYDVEMRDRGGVVRVDGMRIESIYKLNCRYGWDIKLSLPKMEGEVEICHAGVTGDRVKYVTGESRF